MEIVVFSTSKDEPSEIGEVIRMFEAGLNTFHIRKPKLSKNQLATYINQFPKKYHDRLILHTYHGLAFQLKLGGIHLTRKHRKRSKFYQFQLWLKRKKLPDFIITRTFHKMTDVTDDKRPYAYAFLSPVFDSVSQSTLAAGFSQRALHIIIPQAKQPIYAMGGVTVKHLKTIYKNGFAGAAFHGSLWEGDSSPSAIFKQALAESQKLSAQLEI